MTPPAPSPSARHRVRRYADDRGYVASCHYCGWRVRRGDRDQRDRDAAEHARRPATTERKP